IPLIYGAIVDALAPFADQNLVGISCIAAGADSIFAEAVLSVGGELEVVIPSSDYRARKVQPDHAAQFDNLINRASKVRVMPFDVSNREAYEAANDVLLSTCDQLFAIWDGGTAVDKGGTGSVVEEARSRGLPVTIIWPTGAGRKSQ